MTVFKIVLDVILLAIVAFIIIRSVTKGFVASVLKLSRIIVAVLITVLLGGTVANLCAEWFVGAWFEGAFSSKFAEAAASGAEGVSFETLIDSLPVFLRNLLPIENLNEQYASLTGEATESARALGVMVENALTAVISNIFGYVITFVVALAVFSLVIWILDKFVELPILKQVNTALGFLWGVAYSYLFASIIVCIIGFFVDEAFIKDTYVFRFLYNCGLFTHR